MGKGQGLALNAVSAKNDMAVTAVYLYLAALWVHPVPKIVSSKRWLLSVFAASIAVGMKPTLVFIAPGLLFLIPIGVRKTDFSFLREIKIKVIPAVLMSDLLT